MKKFCLILLIALTTCSAIERSFDDNIILEKNNGKAITLSKTRYTIGVTKRLTSKVKNVRNLPIKGINDIFKGKSGEEFRKKDIVKDRNAWIKHKNLSHSRHVSPKTSMLRPDFQGSRNPGQHYKIKINGE